MSIKHMIGLTVVGIALTACQSNHYYIKGFAKGFSDGTAVCLVDEETRQAVRTSVHEGSFMLSGEAENFTLCRLSVEKDSDVCVYFFKEPGNIYVELSQRKGGSRVSGTRLNNEWQLLQDSLNWYGNEILQLAEADSYLADSTRLTKVKALTLRMQALPRQFERRNSDNPLGAYIREHYTEE